MVKPRFCAVIDVQPRLDGSDGFAPRAFHFLKAAAEEWNLDVIAIRKESNDWTPENFLPNQIRGRVTIVEAGENPIISPGLKGKFKRLWHYLFPRQLSGAHPLPSPSLSATLNANCPSVVCFLLPRLAHLGVSVPSSALAVYVLEEGFERVTNLEGNLPNWKAKWMQAAEQHAANRLYKQLARSRGLIISISDFEKNWFARFIPPERIAVIPHGIDCDYFSPTPVEPDFDIMICGVLSHRRNYDPILQLFKIIEERLGKTNLQPKWLVVGKDPPKEITDLRNDRVVVTGRVPDVRAYYNRTKVVVVPAIEGCGVKTTVLQGWAMRRAVVATAFATTGLPVVDGKNILIARSLEELADKIIALLGQPAIREQIASAGLLTVRSERDTKFIGPRFVEAVIAAKSAYGV